MFLRDMTIIDTDEVLYLNREKCVVVPFGINTSLPIVDKNKLINGVNQKKYANGRKSLLCMGRFVELKGFQYALKAMKSIDNAVLFIAGDGPMRAVYEDYVKNNFLEKKVKILGQVNSEDKNCLLSSIDILLVPSIRTESFGIVQLEAMNFGKPVINTNLGTGMNFVSVNKETGLTVEPKNVEQLVSAIKELFNNDEQRMQYGRNAKKRVETLFDIKKIKEEYKNLYKGL